MTLGEKLQKLRKRQKLSQEALAEKVTVTRQTISKWELDQSTPDLDKQHRTGTDYLVSLTFLFFPLIGLSCRASNTSFPFPFSIST